ncbi:hypothetical protein ACFQX6_66100 [Streptosporangium lutulentum]
MWTDVVSAFGTLTSGLISVAALVVAGLAWRATRVQALMSQETSADTQRSADGTQDQAHTAREQLEHAEKVRREQLEPYVVVDIQPSIHNTQAFVLVIENIGPTVARNVKITFDPPVERLMEQRESSFGRFKLAETYIFTKGIPFMPPGRRIELLFDITFERLNSTLDMFYEVTVEAEWTEGRVEPMKYPIDLALYQEWELLGLKNINDGVRVLEEVRNKLGEIKNKLPSNGVGSGVLADRSHQREAHKSSTRARLAAILGRR